uniref:Uncharacterized protein n=1 Tax=Macaca fascicularis TaxID=9541 RepID=A0A7N9CWL2_MACFA
RVQWHDLRLECGRDCSEQRSHHCTRLGRGRRTLWDPPCKAQINSNSEGTEVLTTCTVMVGTRRFSFLRS